MINLEPNMVYSGVAGVYTFTRFVAMDTDCNAQGSNHCNKVQSYSDYHAISFNLRDEYYYVLCSLFLLLRGANSYPNPRVEYRSKICAEGLESLCNVWTRKCPTSSPTNFPNKKRWVGDCHCWSTLDTTGVVPRLALSFSLEPFSWDPQTTMVG